MQDAAAGRSVTRGWRHVPNGLPIERRINWTCATARNQIGCYWSSILRRKPG